MMRSLSPLPILAITFTIIGGIWGVYGGDDAPTTRGLVWTMSVTFNQWAQIVACPALVLLWVRFANKNNLLLGDALIALVKTTGALLGTIGEVLHEEKKGAMVATFIWCGAWCIFGQNAGYYFSNL